MNSSTPKMNRIKCSDRNKTNSPAFFNRKLIRLPITPGRALKAFLAKSRNQFDNLTSTLLKGFVDGGEGGDGVGKRDKTIVEMTNPKAVIIAPIVTPSLRNNSFSLSPRDLVLSLMTSFTLLN